MSVRYSVHLAVLVGVIYAFTIFDFSFLAGSSSYWTEPFGDRITNLVGALYFAHDDWHFPVFFVPKLAFPEGANIIYTDSLPLLALIAKILYKIFGYWVNYFGFWLFACFPLLAFFVAKATKERGGQDLIAVLGAVLLAVASPALLIRFGHAALMGHFLIAWSFYLYLRLLRQPESIGPIIQFCIVAALSVTLQIYFLLMTLPFLLAAMAQLVAEGRRTILDVVSKLGLVMGAIVGTAWLSGVIGPGAISGTAWGFGHYSMNILSPFLPPHEHLPEFIAQHIQWDGNGYTWDATSGQYEGYNYLGFGMLFLLGLHLAVSRDLINSSVRHHIFLVLALAGLLTLALSNKVYIGNWQMLDMPMFGLLQKLTDHFRTGGRLFWPIYYVLVVALVLTTFRRFNPRLAKVIVVLAVCLQLADTQFLRRNMTDSLHQGFAQTLPQETWKAILASHQFVQQYPSFQCGGWAGRWPENNSNMELLLLAAKLNKPINSAYLARPNRSCAEEQLGAMKFDIQQGGLYIFGNSFPINRLEKLPGFKDWCRTFEYGVVCTRGWGDISDALAIKGFAPINGDWAPEYKLGEELEFRAGGSGSNFLRNGWADPEEWGVWAIDTLPEIRLRVPERVAGNLLLTVKAHTFLHGKAPTKDVSVVVNDRVVAAWNFSRAQHENMQQTAIIPKGTVQADGLLKIQFILGELESPYQAGISQDKRRLGIGLSNIILTANSPELEAGEGENVKKGSSWQKQ